MSKLYPSVLIGVCFALDSVTVHSIDMTPQIQQLLQEKQDKIAALEKCEGKKQGWMIAGVSTIGITAIGVAGNLALAKKSKDTDIKIQSEKSELGNVKKELDSVNAEIIKQTDKAHHETQSSIKESKQNNQLIESTQKEQIYHVVKETKYSQLNLDVDGTGKCYHLALDQLPTVEETITDDKIKFECGDLKPGEWIVAFSNATTVRGVSFISKNIPSNDANNGAIQNSTTQDFLTQEYNQWQQSGYQAPNNAETYACYCKMTKPQLGKWVFNTSGSWWGLKDNCASICARGVKDVQEFRESVFKY